MLNANFAIPPFLKLMNELQKVGLFPFLPRRI